MEKRRIDKLYKRNQCKYNCVFVLTTIIDVLFYVFVLVGVALSVVCGILAIYYGTNGLYQCMDDAITYFGIFAGCSIVPIIGIVATIIIDYRSSLREIENDLANCRDLQIFFRTLPLGADLSSAHNFTSALYDESLILRKVDKSYKMPMETISSCDYQITIRFTQTIAEMYRISICDACLINVYDDGTTETFQLRDIDNIEQTPATIKDNYSGAGVLMQGEQIEIFFKNFGSKIDQLNDFLCGFNREDRMPIKSLFRFGLNFSKKDYSSSLSSYFPISRGICRGCLRKYLRRRKILSEVEYQLQRPYAFSTPMSSLYMNVGELNTSIVELQPIDISFKICRSVRWAKYAKYRLATANHELK